MRYFLSVLLFLLTVNVSALAPVKWNQRYQDYIDTYKDLAIYEMLTHNIPASITLAQGLLESSAGNSDLSRKGKNHFGIKCHDWTGPTMHHDDDERGECFRVYETPFDSYEDHSRFLERPRYKKLFSLRRTDYVGWARGLKACGYATNPKYAQLLIDIIRCYKLDDLDRRTTYNARNIPFPSTPQFDPDRGMASTDKVGSGKVYHEVFMNNSNYYVVARKGDSFISIAHEFGMKYKKLAKYNERGKNDVLEEGDIVYFEKKRSKAEKIYKGFLHVVRRGESMYSVAQKYGIRLSSLYKKNKLPSGYILRENDRLRVY